MGVPLFIVDEGFGRIDIVTTDPDNLDDPLFLVDESLFEDIQNNFEKHRVMLDYLITQFKGGNIKPLNEAAREVERKRKKT